jgi:predicted permease
MGDLTSVILPVFLVIGAGYGAVWRDWFSNEGVDGLMNFTQKFAIPALLFSAIASLDLSHGFDPALIGSFYFGAITCFAVGLFGARFLFNRPWADSVAIGFCTLFSNSLLLGLPITERAYGPNALSGNYAIIALHSPICYGIGITVMEVVRAQGTPARTLPIKVLKAIFSNALIVGISLGFIVNLGQIPLPEVLSDALSLLTRAALPAALFGLGGVLYRYRPEGDLRTILFICAVSLILHPVLVWLMGSATGLNPAQFRSAVITAAMAPGVNAYVFANMYGVARRVAASSVLFATALTMLTAWGWLSLLP